MLREVRQGKCDEFKKLRKTKKFQKLVEHGCKLVCKPQVQQTESQVHLKTSDFLEVLRKLVSDEQDPNLDWVFKTIQK